MPRNQEAVTTRSSGTQPITNNDLAEQLSQVLASMVTRQHFDQTMQEASARLDAHDQQLDALDERLVAVEETTTNSNDMYQELYQRKCRENNIIIFKLPEQHVAGNSKDSFKKDEQQLNKLFTDMKLLSDEDDKLDIKRMYRLGKFSSTATSPRPVIVTFKHSDVKEQIFAAVKNLKGIDKWSNVSIADDMTKTQQKLAKKMRGELLKEAQGKNDSRTEDDIMNGIEYKVMGSYGRCNLRVQRIKAED